MPRVLPQCFLLSCMVPFLHVWCCEPLCDPLSSVGVHLRPYENFTLLYVLSTHPLCDVLQAVVYHVCLYVCLKCATLSALRCLRHSSEPSSMFPLWCKSNTPSRYSWSFSSSATVLLLVPLSRTTFIHIAAIQITHTPQLYPSSCTFTCMSVTSYPSYVLWISAFSGPLKHVPIGSNSKTCLRLGNVSMILQCPGECNTYAPGCSDIV